VNRGVSEKRGESGVGTKGVRRDVETNRENAQLLTQKREQRTAETKLQPEGEKNFGATSGQKSGKSELHRSTKQRGGELEVKSRPSALQKNWYAL